MSIHHGMPGHAAAMGGDAHRALIISGWLTGLYFLVELAIGLWTGSVAVMSDAFHTFSAVGGVVIAVVAGRLAQRSVSLARTFGLIRAEILGALFNGFFLVGMAVFVLWMGVMRLRHPVALPPAPMLLAAAGGLITESISLWLLRRHHRGSLNVRGAVWHIIQTFVGSLIVIISAVVIHVTGFVAIDPILGMLFGLVLFWASWGIIREALHILLQAAPEDLDLGAAIDAIKAVDGVTGAHHVHAWVLTSGRNVFSAHVRVRNWQEGERVQRAVHDLLRDRFNIYFSTIQIEEKCLDDEGVAEIDVAQAAE
ncbi:MAG TPA: cation diffusion facilitator family transporter [Azospirillaceae bacterium]|nr:cation diffusion facilitator family transporter [Azospirillaceae bacterium]